MLLGCNNVLLTAVYIELELVIVSKFEFPANGLYSIDVTLEGILTDLKSFQPKANPPSVVTLLGIVTLVNAQSEKALVPIVVTLFGMATLVKL